jgi:hypothetical protein
MPILIVARKPGHRVAEPLPRWLYWSKQSPIKGGKKHMRLIRPSLKQASYEADKSMWMPMDCGAVHRQAPGEERWRETWADTLLPVQHYTYLQLEFGQDRLPNDGIQQH